MKVHVYRNIKTKEPQLSIRCANSHLVLGHCQAALIYNPTYIVQSSGLLRTRATNQRNVHAWLSGEVGYLQDFTPYKDRTVDYDYDLPFEPTRLLQDLRDSTSGVPIFYSPYTYDSFVDSYGSPVFHSVSAAVFSDGTVIGEMTS